MKSNSNLLLEKLSGRAISGDAARADLIGRVTNDPPAWADVAKLERSSMLLEGAALEAYVASVRHPADESLKVEVQAAFDRAYNCLRLQAETQSGATETFNEAVLPGGLAPAFRVAASSLLSGRVAEGRLDLKDLVVSPGPFATPAVSPKWTLSGADDYELTWRDKLLMTAFGAFTLLVRKGGGWTDIDSALAALRRLRDDQGHQEGDYLDSAVVRGVGAGAAFELLALFHLAQLVTICGNYLEGGIGVAARVLSQMDRHIEDGVLALERAANAYMLGDMRLAEEGLDDGDEEWDGHLAAEPTKIVSDPEPTLQDDDMEGGPEPDGAIDSVDADGARQVVELARLGRLLWAGCRELIKNSLWYHATGLGDKAAQFVATLTDRQRAYPILELWPSQQEALGRNLLDQYRSSVLVQMPTSAGKTLLAQFFILQHLSLRAGTTVAYVVPTRALVNQVTRSLRLDFRALGLSVEQAVPSIEMAPVEDAFLSQKVDVLVTTAEKLSLLLRRAHESLADLSLVVVDEAHNIADGERGARLELLLATMRRDKPDVRYLLLSPFLPNPEQLVEWLGDERALAPISVDWRPNRRVVGISQVAGRAPKLSLEYETLSSATSADIEGGVAIQLAALDSRPTSVMAVTSATAKALRKRGSTLILCYGPARAEEVASTLAQDVSGTRLDRFGSAVIRYLDAENGGQSLLAGLLRVGVAYHHAGMSSEAKLLVEEMIRRGSVHTVCGTTTLAQGVNFPISNVLIEDSRKGRDGNLTYSDFWNVAGRAGRTLVDELGVVAFPAITTEQKVKWREFVRGEAEQIASQLAGLVERADELAGGFTLQAIRENRGLSELMQFLAHAMRTAGAALSADDLEDLLRSSLIYRQVQQENSGGARALIRLCRAYVQHVAGRSRDVALSDATGFSTTSIGRLTALTPPDSSLRDPASWEGANLFGPNPDGLVERLRLLQEVPELRLGWEGFGTFDAETAAAIIRDWVNGESLSTIADHNFGRIEDRQKRVRELSRYLLGNLAFKTSWGLGALGATVVQDEAWEGLVDARYVPSMVFFGVRSSEAVWMRMAGLPRNGAEGLAREWKDEVGPEEPTSPAALRAWVAQLEPRRWDRATDGSGLRGSDMRLLWQEALG